MALSGRILGAFDGSIANTSYSRPVIEWSATQSVSGNYSTVTASLVFERYHSTYNRSFNRNGHSVTFTINGNKSTASRTFNIRDNTRSVVWTRTVRVNHNSNGSKSFSLSASGNTGVNLGSYNFSKTETLDPIPRASSLKSFSINAHLQPGTANRVNLGLSRASSSFKHDIQLRDGGTVLQSWNNQGVPSTLTIDSSTVNTLLKRMSSNTTRTLTLRVQTKSGSTNVGSALTRTATATVDSSVRPTATGLSVSIDGSGRDSSRKIYVQGVSRASVKVNTSATGGASITSRRIVVRHNGTKGNVSTITSGSGTSGILTQSGTYEVIATVTDSRGRTNTQTRTTFTVEAYSPPRITTFSAVRNAGTPTTVNINRVGSFSPIGTGHNTLTISVQRRQGTGSWSNVVSNVTTTSSTFSGTVNSTGNSVTQSYEFRVVLTDQFGGRAEATSTVSTQRVVLDIHKNEGVGIGKIHERGSLDVGGESFFQDVVHLEGGIHSTMIPSGDDLNNYMTSGFYYNPRNADVANIANTPVDSAFSLLVEKHAGVKQTFTRYESSSDNNARTWARNYYNGDWADWIEVTTRYGYSSNGGWVRFGNGTQICWYKTDSVSVNSTHRTEGGTSFYRASYAWDFPMTFLNDVIGISPAGTAHSRYIGLTRVHGITRTQASVQIAAFASFDAWTNMTLIAVGRWK